MKQCKPSDNREASRLHLNLNLNLVKQLKQLLGNLLLSKICCR